MVLSSSSYKAARKAFKDSQYNIKRLQLLSLRVRVRIEKVSISLSEEDIEDKVLKNKISLLSALLDVKRKLRVELRELSANPEKPGNSLGEILNPPKKS